MLNFFFYLTMILFLVVCLFMMLLILIQKGRGGGLSSAFGGAGGNTAFGSKTGDVLTWATSIVFGVFLLLGIALNLLANQKGNPPVVPPPPTVIPRIPGGDAGAPPAAPDPVARPDDGLAPTTNPAP